MKMVNDKPKSVKYVILPRLYCLVMSEFAPRRSPNVGCPPASIRIQGDRLSTHGSCSRQANICLDGYGLTDWLGYRLTRYADDWLVTCKSHQEARTALAAAKRILERLPITRSRPTSIRSPASCGKFDGSGSALCAVVARRTVPHGSALIGAWHDG